MATGLENTYHNARVTGPSMAAHLLSVNGQHGCRSARLDTRHGAPASTTTHRVSMHFSLKGELIYQVGTREMLLHEDNCLILGAGASCVYRSREHGTSSSALRIELSDDLLSSEALNLAHDCPGFNGGAKGFEAPDFIDQSIMMDVWMTKVACGIRESVGSGRELTNELYQALAGRVASLNLRACKQADNLTHANRKTRLEIYRRLHAAKDYIEVNYNANLQLEDLSRVACLSKHHFKRLFRDAFQCTPHQYLTLVRIGHASRLLRKSSLPVNEVSGSIGFQNTSSFIRLFRTATGVTPGHYRAQAA